MNTSGLAVRYPSMVRLAKKHEGPSRGSFRDLAKQVDRYFEGRSNTFATPITCRRVDPPVEDLAD